MKFNDADREVLGGQAARLIESYERWFESAGAQGASELATFRLAGYFDRPADAGCLAALRALPCIPGLNDPLVNLTDAQWNLAIKRLTACELLSQVDGSGAIDAHALVRDLLAKRTREQQPQAWVEGHRRLYEHLKRRAPYRPDGIAAL
ncbi:MAG: hypothetical protein ABI612_15225, partial [Betaproteobacteria bacterium]